MVPKIEFGDHCWLWNAGKDANGYGRFWLGTKTTYAHIAVWEEVVGAVPHGLVIDHLCNNPSCVNPDHLEPKTKGENTLRSPVAPAAVNARKTHCGNGHPFDESNTRTANGQRACRICCRDAMRRFRQRSS